MKKLRVMIVDESPFFRRWFRKLILTLPGVQVIGELKDPLSALKFIRIMRPDAVVIDAKIQCRFGTDLVRLIRTITPIPRVIMLTSELCCRYQTKVSEKADYLLDKLTEYERIPEILGSFISAPEAVLRRVSNTL
jgi:DNA-binding LytR/AlgR family response regulator